MANDRNACWALAPALVALLSAAPAWAQDADQPVRLAEADIVVIGERANLLHIPGSGATIETEDLERSRVFSVNEALREYLRWTL